MDLRIFALTGIVRQRTIAARSLSKVVRRGMMQRRCAWVWKGREVDYFDFSFWSSLMEKATWVTSVGIVAVSLTLLAGPAFCQTAAISDPYIGAAENFLVQVSTRLIPVVVNGNIIAPSHPTIQESLDLTEQEAKLLAAIAVDYASKNRSYIDFLRPLRREALFQSIESNKVSEELTRQIESLQNEHAQMVFAKMQELRIVLGTSRFQSLEILLRSQKITTEAKQRLPRLCR
jgi:hypothetical protein